MARSDVQALGDAAETLALAYLTGRGLELLARNFHSRFGEIDLVMRDGECLVFVEVRYRCAHDAGAALQSVGPAKRRRLALAAAWFIARHRDYHDSTVRFDVAALHGPPGDVAVCWLRDAFRPES